MNVPEIIEQFTSFITVTDIIYAAGIFLFGAWLLKTSMGRKALVDSVPRRNSMPFYLPFIPLFIWFAIVSVATSITRVLLEDLPHWQMAFLDHLILCIGSIATMVVIIFLVKSHFARRLKGFGLNAKTLHKDFFAGLLNLFTAWPVVMAAIILTISLGKVVWGQDFQLQQHEELKLIIAHPQLPVRVLIFVATVAVVPVFEEMLFRGLFQSMLRSIFARPYPFRNNQGTSNGAWLAIVISSGIFAMVHANAGHWLALFVLAMCMGYAYEKSGSLLRPIFIHAFFNAISIIATLYQ